MNFFRNVLLVVKDKNERENLLSTITDWDYCDNIEALEHVIFV